jgi:hypothetical protein
MSNDSDPSEASTPASASTSDLLDLPGGEGYRVDSGLANQVTTESATNVILFAGTAESGKTTLLATLYLMFQDGPFATFQFAGSRTLVGFERRVHNARLASQLSKPHTERSKFSEYLHLRVRKIDSSGPAKDILLCDLWGEDFREAKDTLDGCKRLDVIRRADAFVLLVDGGKIRTLKTRQMAKNDPIALLRNVLDCEMLAETASVDVVHTKWDLVATAEDPTESEAFADHIDAEIQRQFAGRVGSFCFSRIAAHSQDASVPLGHGLAALFQKWVDRPMGLARHRILSPQLAGGACEYDRYLARRFAGEGR